jgi:hypothetical protein
VSRSSSSFFLTVSLLVVALAACGGSDEQAGPVTDPDATPDATTTTAPRADGFDSEWCESARRIAAASSVIDAVDPADPEAVEAAVTDMLAEAEAAAPLAPPAIADDVEAALASFRAINAALAAVDYDLLRADLSGVADDQSASERVDAYNVEVCGLEPDAESDDDGSAGGFDPSAGPIRDQLIATFVEQGFTETEAACVIDTVDVTDAAQLRDEQTLVELVETCGIDLERVQGVTGSEG